MTWHVHVSGHPAGMLMCCADDVLVQVNIKPYGAFVDIGTSKPALLHAREINVRTASAEFLLPAGCMPGSLYAA